MCNKRNPGSGCGALEGYNRIHAILGQSDRASRLIRATCASRWRCSTRSCGYRARTGACRPDPDFHRLPGSTPNVDTNLQPDELITAVDLPAPFATRSHYLKVRDRASYAFALVSVAAALDVENGPIAARIALGGVAHKPWRALEAERALAGQPFAAATLRNAADVALSGAKGYEHNRFKIELAKRTIVRAFAELTDA